MSAADEMAERLASTLASREDAEQAAVAERALIDAVRADHDSIAAYLKERRNG